MPTYRIALLSHDFFPIKGGQGRNFSELFLKLTALEHPRFEFIAFSPCENSLPNHHQVFSITNALPGSQIQFSAFYNLFVRSLVIKYRIDLILINGGPGGVLTLRNPGIPFIYCVNHTYAQQATLVPGQSWKKLFVPLERTGYKRAAHLCAISSTTASSLKDAYGISESGISIIPVGIDTQRFTQTETNRLPQSILYVGRLSLRKGVRTLLDAFYLVSKEVSNARLFLVGEGELRFELEEYVKNHALTDKVKFLGFVPESELSNWYRRVQIQVVPSLFEGLGISVLEGLASEALVVASDSPGISDVIDNGKNGYLFPPGDSDALAQQLISILAHPERNTAVLSAGLQTATTKFSWDRIVKEYLRVISSLLKVETGATSDA